MITEVMPEIPAESLGRLRSSTNMWDRKVLWTPPHHHPLRMNLLPKPRTGMVPTPSPPLQQDRAGLCLVTASGAERGHGNVTHECFLQGSSPGNSPAGCGTQNIPWL